MNFQIIFPHVAPGGTPFRAEVSAPSWAHAVREVLEHCAAKGVLLEYVQIADLPDLKGARLDGLKLSNCQVSRVGLQGVSLRNAAIEHTTFEKCFADHTTHLDGSILENIRLVESTLNGMSARGAQFAGLRFESTSAIGLDVQDAKFLGVRVIRSDLSAWKARMAYLGSFEGSETVIASADLPEAHKAALRTYQFTHSRTAAETYLSGLEAATA